MLRRGTGSPKPRTIGRVSANAWCGHCASNPLTPGRGQSWQRLKRAPFNHQRQRSLPGQPMEQCQLRLDRKLPQSGFPNRLNGVLHQRGFGLV